MIDTSRLKIGDIILVDLEDEEGHITARNVKCKFGSEGFQNIEENINKYEVYGSNVVRFRVVSTNSGESLNTSNE
jgi:hypothetical protein